MKKKFMIALFAVMSAASMQAYYIEIKNQTPFTLEVWQHPKPSLVKHQTQLMAAVKPNSAKKHPFRYSIPGIRVKAKNQRLQGRYTIPSSLRGKNITLKVIEGKEDLKLSLKN